MALVIQEASTRALSRHCDSSTSRYIPGKIFLRFPAREGCLDKHDSEKLLGNSKLSYINDGSLEAMPSAMSASVQSEYR